MEGRNGEAENKIPAVEGFFFCVRSCCLAVAVMISGLVAYRVRSEFHFLIQITKTFFGLFQYQSLL